MTFVALLVACNLNAQTPDSLTRRTASDSLARTPQLEIKNGEKIFTLFTTRIDSLKLPDEFLLPNSVRILFDGVPTNPITTRTDLRNGIIYFRYLFRDSAGHQITVRYRALPLKFKPDYFNRELAAMADSLSSDTLLVRRPEQRGLGTIDELFSGTDLRRSGSVVRGITVGTNQDLTVTSGFRLQLEGTLLPGVDVAAALTDENTPIQPEGNTQTLQEFDRVFIEIKSKEAKATIGDFNLQLGGTEFSNLSRRLQGGKLEGFYEAGSLKTEATLGLAVSRGKFNLNQFNGSDGVQGPYRLTGQSGEPFIIVLAGTERVYVNGELQTRGQTNDYIIEYGSGELTFQPRRLITAQSRITVDFQYTDRQYARNFLAAKVKTSLVSGVANAAPIERLTFQATYLSESDDETAPIDFTITDSTRNIIAAAGRDRFKAIDTTAFAGTDSLTGKPRGSYVRVDTLVNGVAIAVYRYLGAGASGAVWSPSFSYVGVGQGSYRRVAFGFYEYAGAGAGNYEAYRLLPVPSGQSLFDLALNASPIDALSIGVEGVLSQNNLNKFAPASVGVLQGSAYKLAFGFAPKKVQAFGLNLGDMEIQASQRQTSRSFAQIDRTLPADFGRDYNLISYDGLALFTEPTAELIRTALVAVAPSPLLSMRYQYGQVSRDEIFRSVRQQFSADVRRDSLLTVNYTLTDLGSRNLQQAETASWTRHNGRAELEFYIAGENGNQKKIPLALFITGELSSKATRSLLADTLKFDSHRITDLTPGVRLPNFFGQVITASYGIRTDDLFISNADGSNLLPASTAETASLDWQVLPAAGFSSQLTFTRRLRKFTEAFRQQGNTDNESILLRLNPRYSPLRSGLESDLLYEVTTEKTSRLDRQFFLVQTGFGNYLWRDRNRDSLKTFDEFVPITFTNEVGDDFAQYTLRSFPSDDLVPTIDLKSNLRLRVRPERWIVQREGLPLLALASISGETLLRVEEKSTERDLAQIYLLNFSKFQNDSTTIAGSFTIQQDVFLFENDATNARFRFQQRRSQSQFSLGGEKRFQAERSVRFVSRVGDELGLEFNAVSATDRVLAGGTQSTASFSIRDHDVEITSLSPDVSYRPFQDLEFGVKVKLEQRIDRLPATRGAALAAKADINSEQVRASYSLRDKGRLNAQIERSETTLRDVDLTNAVYELTAGNAVGTSFIWRVDFDYRINSFITASLGYDGRALPTGRVLNTGRAEVRAVF